MNLPFHLYHQKMCLQERICMRAETCKIQYPRELVERTYALIVYFLIKYYYSVPLVLRRITSSKAPRSALCTTVSLNFENCFIFFSWWKGQKPMSYYHWISRFLLTAFDVASLKRLDGPRYRAWCQLGSENNFVRKNKNKNLWLTLRFSNPLAGRVLDLTTFFWDKFRPFHIA